MMSSNVNNIHYDIYSRTGEEFYLLMINKGTNHDDNQLNSLGLPTANILHQNQQHQCVENSQSEKCLAEAKKITQYRGYSTMPAFTNKILPDFVFLHLGNDFKG